MASTYCFNLGMGPSQRISYQRFESKGKKPRRPGAWAAFAVAWVCFASVFYLVSLPIPRFPWLAGALFGSLFFAISYFRWWLALLTFAPPVYWLYDLYQLVAEGHKIEHLYTQLGSSFVLEEASFCVFLMVSTISGLLLSRAKNPNRRF